MAAIGEVTAWQALAVALAGGLLVGAERERSRGSESSAAGVRTFGAVALLGALGALIGPAGAVTALAAVVVLVAIAYLRTSESDPGLTTEAALLVVCALGTIAPTYPALCVGGAVATTVLLASKERLHFFLRHTVTDTELVDALKFFVAAFVVLPLLPRTPVGPYGVLDLYRIWALVVAITAIGWAAYLAVRVAGPRRGLLVAGLAGGFVSAVATTAALARTARSPDVRGAAVGGALAASVSTCILLGVVTSLVSTEVTLRLLPGLVAGGVVLAVGAVLAGRGSGRSRDDPGQAAEETDPAPATSTGAAGTAERTDAAGTAERTDPAGTAERTDAAGTGETSATGPRVPGWERTRPFALAPALVLALVIAAVLVLTRWGTATFGGAGVVAVAAVAGLADAHATAVGVAGLVASGQLELQLGVAGVLTALVTNTVTKLVVAAVGGGWATTWRLAAVLVPATAAIVVVGLLV